jgi:SPW repeat-containing protein
MAVPMERGPGSRREASPSLVNVMFGLWLFVSAFAWSHGHPQMTNTWICGVLCITFAIAGMEFPSARYLNTLLAVWLFVSSWAVPSESIATVWNNVLCAIAIFVISLVPSTPTTLPATFGRMSPPRSA